MPLAEETNKLPDPTDPNSYGYNEYLSRGGTGYVDSAGPAPSSQPSYETELVSGYSTGYYSGDKTDSKGQRINQTTQNRGDIYFTGGGGGGGGGGGSTLSPTGSISTSKVQRGPTPEQPELVPFEMPEGWTGEERAAEVAKQSALGLREARRSLRETMMGLRNDPASKLARARALEAHGINIERTLGGARRYAEQIEQTDTGRETQAAVLNYQAYLSNRASIISNAWNAWAASGTTISSSQYTYGGDDAADKLNSLGEGYVSGERSLSKIGG